MIRILVQIAVCAALASATIVITSPLQTDFPNNQLQYMYGNFGEIPYGKTLSFDLQVIEKGLCNAQDLDHFTTPTYVVIKANFFQESCTQTRRALNAQAKGAKGIMIATSSYDYADGNVFQGDDGNGKKVHITALFISNPTFQKLKGLPNIQIIAKYPVPKSKISTLSIFISSARRSSYIFLRELQEEYKYLSNYITIDPIFHTVLCEDCRYQNCMLEKYCSFDYQSYRGNVGQKIMREQLHQNAIFSQRGVEKWLQYMNLFDEYCIGDWQNVDACTQNILTNMKMNDVYLANPEETLVTWKIKENRLGFDNFPEVAINNMIYRGNFETEEIIVAFCESLSEPPQYCIDGSKENSQEATTNSHLTIILVVSIVSVLLVIIIVICIYRKFIKRQLTNDMASRVGELVAHYANKVSKQKIRQRQKFIEANDQEL